MTTPHRLSLVNQVPPTDPPTKLCSWQKSCPCYEGEEPQCQACAEYIIRDNDSHSHDDLECAASLCLRCDGTGLVYVLDDSVRVRCEGHEAGGRHYHGISSARPDCVGWTPSTDLAVWVEAIFKAWPDAQIILKEDATWLYPNHTSEHVYFKQIDMDGLPALQSALAQVMEKGKP